MIPTDMARDPTSARETPSPAAGGERWTVIYDDDCGFCRWSLGQILALDRQERLRPLPLGTPEADRLLADLSPDERAGSWHLVAPDGTRWSAGSAAPHLFRLLSGGRLPAAVFAAAPAVTDRVYRWVADHRSSLSRFVPVAAKRRADRKIAARREQD
jgi:predicted DCC family thiol-disulfide oxidoreductase YuxK